MLKRYIKAIVSILLSATTSLAFCGDPVYSAQSNMDHVLKATIPAPGGVVPATFEYYYNGGQQLAVLTSIDNQKLRGTPLVLHPLGIEPSDSLYFLSNGPLYPVTIHGQQYLLQLVGLKVKKPIAKGSTTLDMQNADSFVTLEQMDADPDHYCQIASAGY